MLCVSEAKAVDVSTQGEFDAAISSGATSINILAGQLALSGTQAFAANTDLTIAAGASLSLVNANPRQQGLGSLGGGGTLVLGTNQLGIGSDNSSTAFSGTIEITNQGYQSPFGAFAKGGTGTLTIDGATITQGESYVLQGALAQTSGNSSITYLAVGEGVGGSGALNVSGGTITFGTALQVGDFGGQGTVNQTGGTVKVTPTCGDSAHCATLNIGNQGGVGTYNISGGELDLSGGINTIGRAANSGAGAAVSTLNISGGTVDVSGNPSRLIIGYGNATVSTQSSQGIINQTGGILRIHNGSTLNLSGFNASTGTYNLNGGALEIGGSSLLAGYNNNTPHYQFNLGGGTIRVIESPLVTSVNATLTGGLSTIDTNGLGATWSGVFSGAGGLAKMGAGTLILSGNNSYTGGTFLNGGVLQASADNNLGAASSALNFNGGTLRFGTGFNTARNVTLNGNGGTIDTNGFNTTFSGQIDGTGSLAKDGAGILTLAGISSYSGATLVNAGTLRAGSANAFSPNSSYTVASGASLDFGNFNQSIGSLAGTGAIALGSATLTAGSDNSSSVFSGTLSGAGGLTKVGQGTLSLTGINTYTGPTNVNGGALSVDGSLASQVFINTGGTLMGNGTIGGLNVASGGVAAPGHSIGTLTVAGNVGFGSGSTYLVEVNSAGQSDLIAAGGSAALTGGTVRVLGSFVPGLPYTILTAQGGVSGAFSEVTADSTFAFLSPVLTYMPTSVQVSLTQVRGFASAATTPNQTGVATALDSLPTSGPLFGTILTQSSTAGARQGFDALSGEIHGSVQTVMLDDSRYLRQAVLGRLRQTSFAGEPGPFAALTTGGPDVASTDAGSALAYGDTRAAFPVKAAPPAVPLPSPDIAWWAQGVGAWGSFDGNGNAANVSRSLGGFFTGVDRRFGDYWRAGIAGGYTNASVQANARSSSANVDTAHLAAYAGASYGAWNLRSGAAASWSTIGSSRSIVFPDFAQLATARYNGSTAQLFGEIGYGVAFGRIAAEPFAGLAWAHLDTNAFSEQGGIAALAGSSTTEDVGYTTTGARIATNIPLQDGMMLTPRASAAWQHAFGDLTPAAALTFQSTGVGFDIAGVPLARDAALVEGGFDLHINANALIGVSYTGQIAGSTNDHAVKGNLTWRF